MKIQNGACALTGSAWSEKTIVLFFVIYPKQPRPLLGTFLNCSDVELRRLAIRSPGADVGDHSVELGDELIFICAGARSRALRAFMARQEVAND